MIINSAHLMSRTNAPSTASSLPRVRGGIAGFTLVEVMITTVLTLVLVAALAQVFGYVSENVTDSRAVIEVMDRLRNCKHLLQSDLSGVTAPMTPPLRPEAGHGFFEIVEGPMGPSGPPSSTTDTLTSDDMDDILMFTSRNDAEPFRALFNDDFVTHPVAEVCWFLRGSTLYRRVLLVAPFPEYNVMDLVNIYVMPSKFDVSMRNVGSMLDRTSQPWNTALSSGANASPQPLDSTATQLGNLNPANQNNFKTGFPLFNTLSDLTKRENRYGHQPHAFPHDVSFWGPLGLPTLSDCRFDLGGTTNPSSIRNCWPFPMYDPPITTSDFNPSTNQYGSRIEYWQGGSWDASAWTTNTITGNSTLNKGARTWVWSLSIPTLQDPYDVLVVPNISSTGAPSPVLGFSNPLPGSITFGGTLFVGPGLTDIWNTAGTGLPLPVGNLHATTLQLLPKGSGGMHPYNNKQQYGPAGSGSSPNGAWVSAAEPTDIVMTDVVSFDVKVWDPGAPLFKSPNTGSVPVAPGDWGYNEQNGAVAAFTWGYGWGGNTTNSSMLAKFIANPTGANTQPVGFGAYVDLGYMSGISTTSYNTSMETLENSLGVAKYSLPRPKFGTTGDGRSGVSNIYDTWSTHYETNGIDDDRDGIVDQGTNGADDGANSQGFDTAEYEAPPPYPFPLRGIQIKIRAIEKTSKQVREITLYQEFPGQ